jgi:DUF4097 and DUF4098 domain-containing protein YvlB
VPAKQNLVTCLAAGKILAHNVKADLKLDTQDADVETSHIRGKLQIASALGDVKGSDIRGDSVEMSSTGGNVVLRDADSAKVRLHVTSGNVTGGDIRCNRMNAGTTSGDISLSKLHAPESELHATGGDIKVDFVSDIKNLAITITHGDVKVFAPKEIGAKVDLTTTKGNINVKPPFSLSSKNTRHVSGIIGDGHGDIKIEIISGNINLLPSDASLPSPKPTSRAPEELEKK